MTSCTENMSVDADRLKKNIKNLESHDCGNKETYVVVVYRVLI